MGDVSEVQWVELGDLTGVGNVDMHAVSLVEDLLGDGWVLDDVHIDRGKASARWTGDGPPVIAPASPAGTTTGTEKTAAPPADVPTANTPRVKPQARPRHVPPPRHDGPGGKTLARDEAVRRVTALANAETTVKVLLEDARDAWDKHTKAGGRGEYCWVRHVTLSMLAYAVTMCLDDAKAPSRLLRLYDTSCRRRSDNNRRSTGDLPLSRVVARCADRDTRMKRLTEACAVVTSGDGKTMPEPALDAPFAWDGQRDARQAGVPVFGVRHLDPVADAVQLRGLRWLSGADLARLHARGMRGSRPDPQNALTSLVAPARRERAVRVAACLHRGAVWTPAMLAAATGLDASGFSPQFLYSLRNAGLAKLARAHDGTLLLAGNPADEVAWRALRKRLGIRVGEWERTVTGRSVPLAPPSSGAVPHELAVTELGLRCEPYGRWVPEPHAYLRALTGADVPGLGRCRADGALILYPGAPHLEVTVCWEVTSASALRSGAAKVAEKAGRYMKAMQAPGAKPLIVVYVLLSQPHLADADLDRAGQILARGLGAGSGPRNRVLIAQWGDVIAGLPDITGYGIDAVRQRDEDSPQLAGFHRTDGGGYKRGWVQRRLVGQALTNADRVLDLPA